MAVRSLSDSFVFFNGAEGIDTADYSLRTEDLTIIIDDSANDGAVNESDDVRTDMEVVIGGKGNDTLTGSDLADKLDNEYLALTADHLIEACQSVVIRGCRSWDLPQCTAEMTGESLVVG